MLHHFFFSGITSVADVEAADADDDADDDDADDEADEPATPLIFDVNDGSVSELGWDTGAEKS